MKNKYIYFLRRRVFCFYYALTWLQSLWSCSQFPFLGLPPWSWYTRKALASWKSSLCICSSDALWSRVTEAQTEILCPGVQFALYHLRDTEVSLSPVLPVFLSTVRAGRSQTGWRWKSGLCIQRLQVSLTHLQACRPLGSWGLALAGLSMCMPLLCSPWSSQEKGAPIREKEPRPPSRTGLGRPGPSQRLSATLPSLSSRLCRLWAPVLARVGSAGPRLCPTRQRRPLPGRPLLGAPLPRTPARRSACWALSCVRPCRAMDDLRVLWMRDRVYNAFSITDPQLFEELLNRNDGKAEELIPALPQPDQRRGGRFDSLLLPQVVPEEVEVEIGEPPAAFPPCPFIPVRSHHSAPGRQIPAHPAHFWPPRQSANAYCCPPCPGWSRH